MSDRRRLLLGPNGEKLIYDSKIGMFYPEKMDITMNNSNANNIFSGKYRLAQYLEEATVRGYKYIGQAGKGEHAFSGCSKLKKIVFPNGLYTSNSYIASSCPVLQEVVIGSVGNPTNTTLYNNAFQGSGDSATGAKTITLYIPDSTPIPLANAPWGFSGATVIYRSSTTGEIMEVPT